MHRSEDPVLIFDSGVGGLPYLRAVRTILPFDRYVYFADRAGFPYGSKSGNEVKEMVVDRVSRLVALTRPKALVIACNTASQAALASVRAANPGLPVVGTVPAVKPAAERSRTRTIGIMATARTVEDPYLDGLVSRFAPGTVVLREAAQDLVAFVERRLLDATEEERRKAVEGPVRRLVDGGADQIVIACTHFLHVWSDILAAAGPGVEIVDSREGVARRLRSVLAERGLLRTTASPEDSNGHRDRFILSGEEPVEELYFRFAECFSLGRPEILPLPR